MVRRDVSPCGICNAIRFQRERIMASTTPQNQNLRIRNEKRIINQCCNQVRPSQTRCVNFLEKHFFEKLFSKFTIGNAPHWAWRHTSPIVFEDFAKECRA